MESARYYKMAVDGKVVEALFIYARILQKGDRFSPDKYEAANYFKMGADLGVIECMASYANMLYEGDGIQKDIEQSGKYYKMAADNGDKDSMIQYAKMLEKGKKLKNIIIWHRNNVFYDEPLTFLFFMCLTSFIVKININIFLNKKYSCS